jgi:hypothetical protein
VLLSSELHAISLWRTEDEVRPISRADSKIGLLPNDVSCLSQRSGPSAAWPLAPQPLQYLAFTHEREEARRVQIVSPAMQEPGFPNMPLREHPVIRISAQKRSTSGRRRKPMFTEHLSQLPKYSIPPCDRLKNILSSYAKTAVQDFEPLAGRQLVAVEGYQPRTWSWRTADQS